MTFLNPLMLLALAAVAVPLVLHLFNLRRPRRVEFSSLAFIKALQRSAVQRVRIKQWILLALRMLAIACLVMAFARPTLTGDLAGTVGRQAETAHALIIDNSLSMTLRDRQGEYLAQAKRRAASILDAIDEGEEIVVLPTARDGERTTAPFTSRQGARDAIDALTPQPGAAPLAVRVVQAAQQLADTDAPLREVYVISDLQESMIADSLTGEVPDGVRTTVVPVGDRRHSNVAVTDVRVTSRIAEVGQPIQLEATLTNYGSETLDGYVASVYLQDERVAQATATLEPDVATTLSFTATPQARGWLAGTVEIEDDAFTADNVHFFTLNVPEARRILVVRGQDQPTRFVDLALSTEMVADRVAFQTETIAENALTSSQLGSYDAIVLVGPTNLSSGEISSLARYVEAGGGLLFFPSASARPEDYDALFSTLGGGSFGGFSGSLGQERVIATFDRVDLEHPLFDGVFDRSERRTEVESPDVYYAMNFSPSGGAAQTLIQLSNGFPFLQEIRHGSGVALVAAVAPNRRWSDLPVRGLFIPLLYRSVYYLSAGESVAGDNLIAGQPGEVRLTGVDEQATVRIVGPEGVERTPEQRTLFGATLLETDASLRIPGIYDVLADGEPVRRIALNPDPRESDVETLPADAAVERLREAAGGIVQALGDATDEAEDVGEALQERRAGTEIWNVFLLMALGFLVAEMLLASQWKPETVAA